MTTTTSRICQPQGKEKYPTQHMETQRECSNTRNADKMSMLVNDILKMHLVRPIWFSAEGIWVLGEHSKGVRRGLWGLMSCVPGHGVEIQEAVTLLKSSRSGVEQCFRTRYIVDIYIVTGVPFPEFPWMPKSMDK